MHINVFPRLISVNIGVIVLWRQNGRGGVLMIAVLAGDVRAKVK